MAATADIGIVGLGVMGRNLALNMRDRGFAVCGLDRSEAARERAAAADIRVVDNLPELITRLRRPRRVLLMLPAGNAIDEQLADLLPWLDEGDAVIEGGNSHYRDTMRRAPMLERRGFGYLGLGVSGGEEGARHGPALMAGGSEAAWTAVAPVLEAIAARVEGEPCAARVGADGAGHFVKTVHNGIEYAVMQLIAETWSLMAAAGLAHEEAADRFAAWAKGPLGSYLVEITAQILRRRDPETGGPAIEVIRDRAEQKGTGAWASVAALELGVPAPTIIEAAQARSLSAMWELREQLAAARPLAGAAATTSSPERLGEALMAATVAAYAQGFALIRAAGEAHRWDVDLATVARLWRGGCIIRARLLGPIAEACLRSPGAPSLLADPAFGALAWERLDALREAALAGQASGLPVPALASALAFLDGSRTARSALSLVQAQRDFFGAHGLERTDRPGRFHFDWTGNGEGAP
ncbi:NADP-dependent phosphogluconate dehydrogenase [Geminicoccaceae bacterium 1502E]|nr:NADP-dependent phosphogluconate dehydrogenase [Geminicoccaceae bacterium 1502E]